MIKQNRSVKAVCGGKNTEENLHAKTQFTAKKTETDIKNMQYILVTGAYGGMGRTTVQLLKKQGFFVFALDRKIGEAEENVFPIEADITDESSLARAAETIKKKTDALFAIVHYAGIYMLDSLAEIERESFERIFRINLFGAFLVNKTFLPFLRKGGRIVITTSELAPLDPLPFTGLYAVTKSALDKYAYSLRMELQLLGISVSVLRAGAVKTDMLGVSTSALDVFCEKTKLYKCNADRFKKIVSRVEAKNIEPEKIAAKTVKIVMKKSPAFAYAINRNPLLRLFGLLPKRIQFKAIELVLK